MHSNNTINDLPTQNLPIIIFPTTIIVVKNIVKIKMA